MTNPADVFTQFQQRQQAAQISLDATVNEVNARTDSIVASTEKQASLQKTITTQSVAAELLKQSQMSNLMSSFDATNLLTSLGEEYQQRVAESSDAYNLLQESRSANLFDNPVGFLDNLVNEDTYMQRVQDATSRAQAVHSQITGLTTAVTSASQMFEAAKESMTAQTADAAIQLAAEQSKANADKVALETLKFKSGVFNDQVAMSARGLEASISMRSQELAEQRAAEAAKEHAAAMKMHEAQFAMAQKNQQMAIERFDWEKGDRQKLQEAEAAFLDPVNKGLGALGSSTIPNSAMLNQQLKVRPELIAKAYAVGSSMDTTGNIRLGDTPYQVFKTLDLDGTSLPAIQAKTFEPVQKLIASIRNQIMESPAGKSYSKEELDKAVEQEFYTRWQETKSKEWMTNSTALPVDQNPYAPLDFQTLADRHPELKDTALWGKVIQPLAVGGTVDFNPEKIVLAGIGQDMSIDIIAKELAKFSEAAVQVNNAERNYFKLALPPQTYLRVDDAYNLNTEVGAKRYASMLALKNSLKGMLPGPAGIITDFYGRTFNKEEKK